jgi:hypothetical protein
MHHNKYAAQENKDAISLKTTSDVRAETVAKLQPTVEDRDSSVRGSTVRFPPTSAFMSRPRILDPLNTASPSPSQRTDRTLI